MEDKTRASSSAGSRHELHNMVLIPADSTHRNVKLIPSEDAWPAALPRSPLFPLLLAASTEVLERNRYILTKGSTVGS